MMDGKIIYSATFELQICQHGKLQYGSLLYDDHVHHDFQFLSAKQWQTKSIDALS